MTIAKNTAFPSWLFFYDIKQFPYIFMALNIDNLQHYQRLFPLQAKFDFGALQRRPYLLPTLFYLLLPSWCVTQGCKPSLSNLIELINYLITCSNRRKCGWYLTQILFASIHLTFPKYFIFHKIKFVLYHAGGWFHIVSNIFSTFF